MTTTPLPALRLVLPAATAQRLELVAAQGQVPAPVLATVAGALSRAMQHPDALEETVACLDALVPYDMTTTHGCPFSVQVDGGDTYDFATLVGAYAVAGLELAAQAPSTAESHALLAHVVGRLTERDGLSARVVNRRLEDACIAGGLSYLEILVETLGIQALTGRDGGETSTATRLAQAEQFDVLCARGAPSPLDAYLVRCRDSARRDVACREAIRAEDAKQWQHALICTRFGWNDEAATKLLMKTAYQAEHGVNLYDASQRPVTWADVRRVAPRLAGPIEMPRRPAPDRFVSRVKAAKQLVFDEMQRAAPDANVPRAAPAAGQAWTLTYAAVLYGRWSVAGGAAPWSKGELRALLLAHGVDPADLDFPDTEPVRVPLAAAAAVAAATPSVLDNVKQRLAGFFHRPSTTPTVPTPASPVPAPLPPTPAPTPSTSPAPLDIQERMLSGLRK